MSFLASWFCGHRWVILDSWNIHRNSDNKVCGIATRLHCEKCGTVRMTKSKF